MSVEHDVPKAGSVTLTDDADPSRTLVIRPKSEADRDAKITAFFAAIPSPEPDPLTEINDKLAPLGLTVDDLRAVLA